MGCDIHLYVERRGSAGGWLAADEWTVEEDEDSDGNVISRPCVNYYARFYNGRCYDLFAILADVRNGIGFAGVDMGDRLNPIDQPRGLPDDTNSIIRQESENWGCDGHSHSWLTVAELLAYDWTQVVEKRGYVNAAEYSDWIRWRRQRGEGPESYCGGVGGGATKIISEPEMAELVNVAANDKELPFSTYCKVSWIESYHSLTRHFWWSCIPKLLALGKPEDVRIVFWFDN